jgi:hypothetical protein
MTISVFGVAPALLCLALVQVAPYSAIAAAPSVPGSPAQPTPMQSPAPHAPPTLQSSPFPAAPPTQQDAGTTVTIPGGTTVTVQLLDKISSSNANVGDTFAIRASKQVSIDGWVIIEKGAPGQGEVLSVDRAGSHGHPGTIGIQMDWIYATDGEKIKLTSERKTSEGESKAGVSSTVTIISWAFLGLPGLFMHNFVKGRDVVLDSSHPVDSFVADTVHVAAKVKESAPESGFAH